jgi:diguanylate cyclase (GGDEF)-like protein
MEKTLKENRNSQSVDFVQLSRDILAQMKELGNSINDQFKESGDTTDNGSALEEDTSAAKILIVSSEPPPESHARSESGIALDIIHVSSEDAMEKAAQVTLDAALIEVNPQNSALGLARKLRDISGYESLPLGFISTPQASDARADAAHAGSSVFLPKPLDSQLVQKVINQLISMREGGRFRVLVVDDDVDLANLTSRCLGQFGILTRTVNDPLNVQTAMQEFSPDLILLDVNMPGMSGFEVCRALRNTARWRDVPILFLTAQTDLNSRLTAYEAGADDYLPKPVINVELLTRVKVRLERARELKERSEKDLLTGLFLRRAFSDQVDALIAECLRYKFHFSLCLMDVDHFKKVNDTYGHHAGDEVLAALGKLLRKRFRVEDLRGRWGGEEFILAFKHEKKDLMQMALQRVMEELMQIEFKGEQGEIFHVSFSAGLASYPDEGHTLQALTKVADKRLYLAKERGRRQIVSDD